MIRMAVCAVAAQQNPVSLAGSPVHSSNASTHVRNFHVAAHVTRVGNSRRCIPPLLCSIVSAVVGHDFAIASPDSLLLRLGLVFSGAGLVGALPLEPFVQWLSRPQRAPDARSAMDRRSSAHWRNRRRVVCASRGASTRTQSRFPGVLLGRELAPSQLHSFSCP